MAQAIHDPAHLTIAARRLAAWLAQPKHVAIGCLVLLAGLGWAYLGFMLASMGAVSHSPVASLPALDLLADWIGLGGWGRATLEALCRPSFGTTDPAASIAGFAVVSLMWVGMVLAMICRPRAR